MSGVLMWFWCPDGSVFIEQAVEAQANVVSCVVLGEVNGGGRAAVDG